MIRLSRSCVALSSSWKTSQISFPRSFFKEQKHLKLLHTGPEIVKEKQNRLRKIALPVVGGLILVTVGGTKYFYDYVGGTEHLRRSMSFYSIAIPKYLVYRYHMWRGSPDEVWDELDRRTSKEGLDKMLELHGFYIKAGQMCASNVGDAFPQIWQDTMSVLQDQVPPQPFHIVKETVESELDFHNVFASFDSEPIGAASIGQVHRAVLKDGTRVVVKVCYPNVERLLKGDVRTLKAFARIAQPVHVHGLEEIEKQFQTEFDYRIEARNLETVRQNLLKAGLMGQGKLCQVPKPFLKYCTKRVLVMEELSGDKLIVELKRDLQNQAERAGQSAEEYVAALKAQELELDLHGKELKGPSSKQYDFYINILDGKRRLSNLYKLLHNVTLAWLPRQQTYTFEDKSALPLNHAKLVDDIIYIHGHEVLVDGIFNGDPHPGNILLCRTSDGTPQLGLIDYGQVKLLSKELRHLMCRIIIALDDNNKNEVVKLMKKAGFKSKRMDSDVIYDYARVAYDQDNKELTKGLHIQMFMEELQARDPIYSLPTDFHSVSRCTLLIRGLAHALHQSRSIAKVWRPIAERVLKEDI